MAKGGASASPRAAALSASPPFAGGALEGAKALARTPIGSTAETPSSSRSSLQGFVEDAPAPPSPPAPATVGEQLKRVVLVLKGPAGMRSAEVTKRTIAVAPVRRTAAGLTDAPGTGSPPGPQRPLSEKQRCLMAQVQQQRADATRAAATGCYMPSGLRKGYREKLDGKYTFALIQPSRKVAKRDLKQFFASFTREGSDLYKYMEAICTARSEDRESFRGFVVGVLRNASGTPVAAATLRLGPLMPSPPPGTSSSPPIPVPRFHRGIRYLEMPFFATFPRHRGEGHTIRLLNAVETLAVRCSCTHLILQSVPEGPHATKSFWCRKYGFDVVSDKETLTKLGAREGSGLFGTTVVALEDTVPLMKPLVYNTVLTEGVRLAERVAAAKQHARRHDDADVDWGEAVMGAGVLAKCGVEDSLEESQEQQENEEANGMDDGDDDDGDDDGCGDDDGDDDDDGDERTAKRVRMTSS